MILVYHYCRYLKCEAKVDKCLQTYHQSSDYQISISQAMIAMPHVYGFALM